MRAQSLFFYLPRSKKGTNNNNSFSFVARFSQAIFSSVCEGGRLVNQSGPIDILFFEWGKRHQGKAREVFARLKRAPFCLSCSNDVIRGSSYFLFLRRAPKIPLYK